DWIKLCIILSMPFLIQFIGFVLSDDKNNALISLEKNLLFLFVPLGFSLGKNFIKKKYLDYFLIVFIASCFIINSYVLSYLLFNGFFQKINEVTYYNPIFRNIYAQLTGTHLPYLGMWFMFSCISIAYLLLRKDLKLFQISILIFIGAQLLIGTFIFSARMSIVALIITIIFSFIIYFKSFKKTLILIFFLTITLF